MRRTMTASTAVCVLALAVALSGRPVSTPAHATQTPQFTDLNLVPADAASFCHIRVGEFSKTELFKKLQEDRTFSGDVAKKFQEATGLRLTDLATITIVTLPRLNGKEESPCVAILTTNDSVNRDVILKTAMPDAKELAAGNKKYFHSAGAKGRCLYFVNDRTLVVGPEPTLKRFLTAAEGKGAGELASALKIAGQHHVVCAFRPQVLSKRPAPTEEWMKPFQDLRLGTLVMDFSQNKTTAHLTFTFPDEAKAQAATDATKKGLEKAEKFVEYFAHTASQDRPNQDVAKMILPLERLHEAFKNARVEQRGAEVRVMISAALTAEDYAAILRGVAKGMFTDKGQN